MNTHAIDTVFKRRAVLAALALAAALTACKTTQPVVQPAPQTPPQPELAAFKAVLRPQDVVPPANSAAKGELVAVFNRTTGLLRFRIQFGGLSGPVRAAAFHSPAMEGEVAAPVLSIGRAFASPYEGRAILSPRQSANLLSGQWYVELRTERFPGGELRGQMIEQTQ
ncbi:MAG: CHRD domain-containing protein [Ottowia sp.]|nr:CHRD domain-containing protein [Ottowia sp.]